MSVSRIHKQNVKVCDGNAQSLPDWHKRECRNHAHLPLLYTKRIIYDEFALLKESNKWPPSRFWIFTEKYSSKVTKPYGGQVYFASWPCPSETKLSLEWRLAKNQIAFFRYSVTADSTEQTQKMVFSISFWYYKRPGNACIKTECEYFEIYLTRY
jgi:hypothetical protein